MNRRHFLEALAAAVAVAGLPALAAPLPDDTVWRICTITEPAAFGGACRVLTEGSAFTPELMRLVGEAFERGMIRGFGFHSMPRRDRDQFLRDLGVEGLA